VCGGHQKGGKGKKTAREAREHERSPLLTFQYSRGHFDRFPRTLIGRFIVYLICLWMYIADESADVCADVI